MVSVHLFIFFFFKQKTAYEMRISDWSSDVCSSDLLWTVTEEPTDGESVVWPVDADGNEKVWTCSVPRLRNELDDVRVIRGDGNSIEIQKKYRPNQIGRASCRERVCQYV